MSHAVGLTREGQHFRLTFSHHDLVSSTRALPFCQRDARSASWTTPVSTQSRDVLRTWYYQGLCEVSVDDLIDPSEQLVSFAPATLRSGSSARPYLVSLSWRDDRLYSTLAAIPSAKWSKRDRSLSMSPVAAPALADLVAQGVLADPHGVLSPHDVTVAFDVRSGDFRVFGDQRAAESFAQHFPDKDPVRVWSERGVDVGFLDELSAEVYAGELARRSPLTVEGLREPLYDYQAVSVACAVARSGFAVFHSPGLGKTPIGVATGLHLLNVGAVPRVVVICPAAVRHQWMGEITRFSGHEDVALVEGDLKRRTATYTHAPSCRWVVVHYDVLARDLELIRPLMRGCLVVIDEAHRAKDPSAQRTKALHKLVRLCSHRLSLTGTPVESTPDEWYWTLSLTAPSALGSFSDFANRYMFPGRFGGFEGARNLDELAKRSRPHFIRFTKAEVASHLPPLRIEHMSLDVDTPLRMALRRAHADAAAEIKALRAAGRSPMDADDLNAGSEMTATAMLRLMCSSPRLVHMSDAPAAKAMVDAGLVPDVDGPKVDELRQMCVALQNSGERVVVFTSFATMANLVAERLAADGVRYVTYTGDTSGPAREQATRSFQDPDSDVTVFLATDAAAEGLNLGRCCSLLVNLDVPWTPTRFEQRANRIHRIDGTASRYLVINMTVHATIEDGISKLVEHKADIASAIFEQRTMRPSGRRTTWMTVAAELLEDWSDSPRPRPVRSSAVSAAKTPASDTGDIGRPGAEGLSSFPAAATQRPLPFAAPSTKGDAMTDPFTHPAPPSGPVSSAAPLGPPPGGPGSSDSPPPRRVRSGPPHRRTSYGGDQSKVF